MEKKEFIKMLASSLEELIEAEVLYVETESEYNPYSGSSEPYYNSFIKVNHYNLEEYLKTL